MKPSMIRFARFSTTEQEAVNRIVDRTRRMLRSMRLPAPSVLEVNMDVAAVHAQTPLQLSALAEADDFNFAHDMLGIRSHLNRSTGVLEDCFIPRFAGRA